METNTIEGILDEAYHRAAYRAAWQIRQHLRPFNLKRHPLDAKHGTLTLGGTDWLEFLTDRPVHQAVREAGEFVDHLPAEVQSRLKDHL